MRCTLIRFVLVSSISGLGMMLGTLADGSVCMISETINSDHGASQVLNTDSVVDSPWKAMLGRNDGLALSLD